MSAGTADNAQPRYRDLAAWLRQRFGCRVQKISLDAGMTCPNRDGRAGTGGCVYCNATGSGTGAHAAGLSITEQLRRGRESLGRRYGASAFIAYFQSFTNTYAPVETLRRLYDEALAVEGVVGLSVGTRPDCVDRDVIALLQSYAARTMVWVEYGLQSIHDRTLERINRGHTSDAFRRAVEDTAGRGIHVCTHLILGLPGENRDDMRQTAEAVARLPVNGAKVHLLYVIRGTRMEQMLQAGEYRCMEQDEYADAVCDVLERLPSRMVIQRLTGDPHPEELVGPAWALRKQETLSLIRRRLGQRQTWQGRLTGASLEDLSRVPGAAAGG